MNRISQSAFACILVLAVPIVTLAQHVSSGGHPSAPAPVNRSAPAPVYHPAAPPVTHPSNPGFGFPHGDIHGAPPPVHAPTTVRAPSGYHVAPQEGRIRVNPPHIPYPTGPYHNWRGPVVQNPHRWCWWCWNHGIVWYPVPYYWGGGFWGPWVWGAPGVVLFGSIIDYNDQEIYPSYEIGPSSPGAQLLADYGLTQTECGPPNLVVIWGPNNSVICAYPNNLVSPGNYELDPATLTIQSLNAPSNP